MLKMDINEFRNNYVEDLDFKEKAVSFGDKTFTAVRRYTSREGKPILKVKDKDWNSLYQFEDEFE